MSLFGDLFRGRKNDTDLDVLKKDKRLYPLLNLIMVIREGDNSEIMAALAKTMKCWKCGLEFPLEEFLKEIEDKDGWLMVKCPNRDCRAEPIFFGPGR
ncbi:MAG: hypothetical protein ABRQ38_10140 [Candidatus Eremiobacterota bacterium]